MILVVGAAFIAMTGGRATALAASAVGAAPLAVDGSRLAACNLLVDPPPGTTCGLWYAGPDEPASEFDFVNLGTWALDADDSCRNAGASDLMDWIRHGYPTRLDVASDSVSICIDMGHSSFTWPTLSEQLGSVLTVPVQGCANEPVDSEMACSAVTPGRADMVGFVSLRPVALYAGTDPEAIGTPAVEPEVGATPGACGVREPDPNARCLVVQAVTPRYLTDIMLSLGPDAPIVGDDVYASDARVQQLVAHLPPGGTVGVRFVVENDGQRADRFGVAGPATDRNWRVRYRAAGEDVTALVVDGTYVTERLEPGSMSRIRVVIRLRPTSRDDADRFDLEAWSSHRPARTDAVTIRARTD
jgi:hypothetical protein